MKDKLRLLVLAYCLTDLQADTVTEAHISLMKGDQNTMICSFFGVLFSPKQTTVVFFFNGYVFWGPLNRRFLIESKVFL